MRRLLAAALVLACAGGAHAQPSAPPAEPDEVAASSPRAAVEAYLELCRAGRYAEAAAGLDLPDARRGDGPQLARRLKAVLDRHAWVDTQTISAEPEGDTTDGLAANREQIATVPGEGGTREPVRLIRKQTERGPVWLFAQETTRRIDGWYGALRDRWLLDRLPPALLRAGPGEILYWQWIALPGVLVIAWILGYLLARVSRFLLGRVAARTATRWDDVLLVELGGPLTAAWMLGATYALLPLLGLYRPAHELAHDVLGVAVVIVFFWALVRAVSVGGGVLAASSWSSARGAARQLAPLATRFAKVVVVLVGGIAVLSKLGFPVGTLVAGLGIGGLAIGLAGQKTLENLFGAFALGVDQPFREGDYVKVEDFTGTVESIGLRSTRFRTLDRTVVSIPNGKLADMRLETYAPRDRIRLVCQLGLAHGTRAAQLRAVLADIEARLAANPSVWEERQVRLVELAEAGLRIEVMIWLKTTAWSDFLGLREEILLGLVEAVEGAGAAFAYPTRTVHLAPPREPPASKPAEPE